MVGGFGIGFTEIFGVAVIILIIVLVWPHFKQVKGLGNPEKSVLDIPKE